MKIKKTTYYFGCRSLHLTVVIATGLFKLFLIYMYFPSYRAVEIWGRGTNRVIEECRRIGVTPLTFEETQGFLLVTFKTDLIPGSQKGTEKSKEKGKEKSREKIIHLLQSQPMPTTQELIKHVGLSKSGIEKIIRQLKKDNIIKRIGPNRGGHWKSPVNRRVVGSSPTRGLSVYFELHGLDTSQGSVFVHHWEPFK